MALAVVVVGSTYVGFEVVGPFKSEEGASRYVDELNESGQIGNDCACVHELVAPDTEDVVVGEPAEGADE